MVQVMFASSASCDVLRLNSPLTCACGTGAGSAMVLQKKATVQ
ncbi:MAG TPA: hypothetical protein VNA23_07970 [Anaerolineales bacterium]|nr:hypothetical protein [Anaerolineales bacterium]